MANIGIVLSGGILKGAYQIGALKYISEMIDIEHIKCISAASVGALNGYAYATNNIDIAISNWKKLDELNNGSIIDLLRGKYVDEFINDMCNFNIKPSTNIFTPVFNILKFKLEYFNLSKVSYNLMPQYLKASISLPPFKRSMNINGNKYIDGAVIDNIPIETMMDKKLDYIICIYFDKYNYVFENNDFDKRIIRINYSNDSFIKNSVCLNKINISNMINTGYEKSSSHLYNLLKNGVDDVEYIIYKNTKFIKNAENNELFKVRVTGDTIVDNFNKITSKIISKQVIDT